MNDIYLPQPKITPQRRIAPIWMLPILALAVGGWLVWRSLLDMGPIIEISFENGDGIIANQTQVKYKGIAVGMVKALRAKDDLTGVIITVELDKQIAKRLGGVPKETQFWLVQPQVTLAGVSGLSTIFSGNYIEASLPANEASGEFAEAFTALKTAPPLSQSVPGLHIKFKTEQRGAISVGTPIFSRQIQIGSVKTTAMADDHSGVIIDAHILPEYEALVRQNTRFWNASGVQVQAGLGGVKVELESLASLLAGGITMSAPDMATPAAADGDSFFLYEDFEAADASVFVNVQFPSAEGLSKGSTKVMYKGIAVGKLRDLWYDHQKDAVFGRFGIDPRFESFITDKTRFWLVKPQLSAAGVSGLDALVSGAYLAFTPDAAGTPVRDHNFLSASGPDPLDFSEPGLHLRLKTPSLGAAGEGAPVYYREFVVGSVQSRVLEQTGGTVHILIRPEYRHLVNGSSRFWNVSGVQVHANLKDGLQIQSAPLAALMAGGIAFDTPDSHHKRELHDGDVFNLHASERDATAPAPGSLPGLYLTLDSEEAGGIQAGSPVLYRDLPVGTVEELRHSDDGDQVQVRIHVQAEHIKHLNSASRFWRASAVEMKLGGGGLTVRTGSAAQLLGGGVAFDHFADAGQPAARPARSGDRFRLFAGRDEAEKAGINVRLQLASAAGLSTGSEIRYRGLALGEITSLQLAGDLGSVTAEAALKGEAARLLTSGSRFWQVQPAVGLARTAHLDSLLGSYIELRPGAGPDTVHAAREFTVSTQEPVLTALDSGLNLVLTASRAGSVKAGDPLLYRQVKVGEVLGHELSSDGSQVRIYANIWPKHASLVRRNSHFTNASGMRVKAGLTGVSVDTESVESLLAGGIAFSTPEKTGEPATNGETFPLHDAP